MNFSRKTLVASFCKLLEAVELEMGTTGLSPMEAVQEIYLYLPREGYLDG